MTTIEDVISSAVGIGFYRFLTPTELLSLSLSNKNFSKNIRENIFATCLRQQSEMSKLPSDGLGGGAEATITISREHSFTTREDLADCLLERIRIKNLRRCVTPSDSRDIVLGKLPDGTLEGTLDAARDELSDESRWDEGRWHGTFKIDPVEIWKKIRKPFAVSCRYEPQLHSSRDRVSLIDWMLRELGQDSTHLKHKLLVSTILTSKDCKVDQLTRDWARFILSQKDIKGREWHWKCDDEEEVGFTIYTPEGRQELEIRLNKKALEAKPVDPFGHFMQNCHFAHSVEEQTRVVGLQI